MKKLWGWRETYGSEGAQTPATSHVEITDKRPQSQLEVNRIAVMDWSISKSTER